MSALQGLILTGEVGGITRTENTRWPDKLAAYGLEGFKAFDTQHGVTTVILPTGYGVIVRVNSLLEGCYEKCTPGLLAYCLFSHAAKGLQAQGEPLLCLDGEYRGEGHIGISAMYGCRRLTLQKRRCDPKAHCGERWELLGDIDPVWVAEQINQRPDLLDGFKF